MQRRYRSFQVDKSIAKSIIDRIVDTDFWQMDVQSKAYPSRPVSYDSICGALNTRDALAEYIKTDGLNLYI